MGLRSYLQGHGWDGTQETPVEQHTRAMRDQVAAFKQRYAEPRPELPTRLTEPELLQRLYGYDLDTYRRSGERRDAAPSRRPPQAKAVERRPRARTPASRADHERGEPQDRDQGRER